VVPFSQNHKTGKAKAEGKLFKVDRDMKELKSRLERLHSEIRNAESSFGHVAWLQERFPSAKYEDVTGLCKLASLADIK
jgi:type I restriction enzyme M protein